MDKKRLEDYKKKLQARREELLKSIARTEEEGRAADDDPTVDLADKAANSYTKEFLFGQNNTDRTTLQLIDEALERIKKNTYGVCEYLRNGAAAEAARSRALGAPLHHLPGKARTGTGLKPALAGNALQRNGSSAFLGQVLRGQVCSSWHSAIRRPSRFRRALGAHLWGLAGGLTSVLFPAPCRICGKMLDNASRIPICRACLALLAP